MRVVNKCESVECKFEDIENGGVFLYMDCPYIRLNQLEENAIDLDGDIFMFDDFETVTSVDAELVIYP